MQKIIYPLFAIPLLASSMFMTGCASTQAANMATMTDKDQEIATLNDQIKSMESEMNKTPKETSDFAATEMLLPQNAKPGQCYARAFVPPTYTTENVRVLKSDASQRVETTAPRYEWTETKVMTKAASEHLEVVPETYEWVEEQVLVKPASKRLEVVPAQYKTTTEQVIDKPEHTIWKKGNGPITKVNESTGEIMCLVTIPASYKTVSQRILVNPETTREIEIPAEYTTVKKRVMKTPPSTRKTTIPAEYKTVKTRNLVEDAKSTSVEIPAQYADISKTVMVTGGHIEWRPVLCETNATPGTISKLQSALLNAGYNPGPIDGVIGAETLSAVAKYQKDKGLATGGLTIKTLELLNVL